MTPYDETEKPMKHFGKTFALLAFSVLALSQTAYALGEPKADEFVQQASLANLTEIETSKVALERSKNTDVRAFAQKMVDEHTSAGAGLKSAAEAASLGSSVATGLDEDHQDVVEKLRSTTS